ncbi:hypothetical protein BOX15_Mlig012555g1, partial [Macrostomum lignano]
LAYSLLSLGLGAASAQLINSAIRRRAFAAPAMLQSIFSTDFDLDRLLSFGSPAAAATASSATNAGGEGAVTAAGGVSAAAATGDCKSSDSGLPQDETDESSLLLADSSAADATPQRQPSPPPSQQLRQPQQQLMSLQSLRSLQQQQQQQQLELRVIVRDNPATVCDWGRSSDLVILNARCQEPLRAELDIRTAHIILDYMEMHLSDKQKLREEWEELQEAARQPHQQDGRLFSAATRPENADKNRRPDRLPYDRTRVRLLPDTPGASDYINASLVQDSRLPRHLRGDGGGGGGGHILTQSPLTATIGEFWRLVWQTGATGLVNLARPGEPGLPDYWPDRGCAQFGGFQVHLVSEHVCSDHFVIRSLRVRPLAAAGAERRRLGPARTVTQFHYLSWEEAGVPPSTSSLLEFRRKVNKSYRSRSSPLIVHCSDGAGRSGAFCLLDSVLARLCSGIGCLKEVSLAASLEHLRDQRPGLVDTAEQLEFVFSAVADELAAVLASLSQ